MPLINIKAMKKLHKKTPYKTSDFLGTFQPKIKRIATEPRQRFRQLLRSSIPATQARDKMEFDAHQLVYIDALFRTIRKNY